MDSLLTGFLLPLLIVRERFCIYWQNRRQTCGRVNEYLLAGHAKQVHGLEQCLIDNKGLHEIFLAVLVGASLYWRQQLPEHLSFVF